MAERKHIMGKFRIDELSGVTRPAQEGALVRLTKADEREYWKADFSAGERKQLAASGAALPDGSFPISNVSDLKNAVQAIGRASDPDAAKRHIISRARTLDALTELPDTWQISKGVGAMSSAIKKALGLAETATDAEVEAAITKSLEAGKALEKAQADAAAALVKAGMSDAEKSYCKDMAPDEVSKFMGKKPEDRAAAMKKAADIAKADDEEYTAQDGTVIRKSVVGPAFSILKSQDSALKKAADDLAIEKAARETATFAKLAGDDYRHVPGTVEKKAGILKSIYGLKDAERDEVLGIFKAYDKMIAAGFAKIGAKPPAGDEGAEDEATADDKLKKGAEALVKAAGGPSKLSFAKAYDEFIQTPEGGELYTAYRAEQRAAAQAN